MKIQFTGSAMAMPDGMSLKAALAWRYLEINSGGWMAAETFVGNIIVTDESGDLYNASTFNCLKDFENWLADTATDALKDAPASFLQATGAIAPALLSDAVVEAAVAAIENNDKEENRK